MPPKIRGCAITNERLRFGKFREGKGHTGKQVLGRGSALRVRHSLDSHSPCQSQRQPQAGACVPVSVICDCDLEHSAFEFHS